jgi:molecular chaperone GrpE
VTQGHDERGSGESRPAGPVPDGEGLNRPTAGPDPGDGGALRAGASSTPPSPVPPAEGAEEAGAEVQADLDALTAAEQARDEYLELAKRTQADFENFRKRMAAEVQAAAGRGKGELIREIVPVLDDLERALQAAGLDPEGDSPDGLAHGVLLVFRSLREALVRNGIETLDPKGEKFDPQWHEALSTQPADGADPGTVLEVLQKGYRLDDQLIRPARVVVSE